MRHAILSPTSPTEGHLDLPEALGADAADPMGRLMRGCEAILRQLCAGASERAPTVARALEYGLFSPGKRLRPRLLLASFVAASTDALDPEGEALACHAAAALELVHTASLVHDDLPCFDDADLRRGRPSMHRAFGEATAVLCGDAMIVLAFQTLAAAPGSRARRALRLSRMLAEALGPEGVIGGQWMELDGAAPLPLEALGRYHARKTARLFEYACAAGAIAALVGELRRWRGVGRLCGLAYQVADDLFDVLGHPAAADKPVGNDARLGRPNIAHQLGAADARARLGALLDRARAELSAIAARPEVVLAVLDALGVALPLPPVTPSPESEPIMEASVHALTIPSPPAAPWPPASGSSPSSGRSRRRPTWP